MADRFRLFPAAWVTADEAYGGDPALRGWLERRGLSSVLAVKCTEQLVIPGPHGSAPRASAERLAAGVPAERWVTASAGQGAKGRRLCDWTRIELAAPAARGMARWLLVRRRRGDGELAFYACFGPAATSLLGLVRVAGSAGWWRRASGWPRARSAWTLRGPPVAGLVSAHHPDAAGARVPGRHPRPCQQRRRCKGGRRGLTGGLGVAPLTVPEVRRLLVALVWTMPVQPGLVLTWSRWRRRHQAWARRAHYQRQQQQLRWD
jgi:hypothetical protein